MSVALLNFKTSPLRVEVFGESAGGGKRKTNPRLPQPPRENRKKSPRIKLTIRPEYVIMRKSAKGAAV